MEFVTWIRIMDKRTLYGQVRFLDCMADNISLHVKNIYEEELDEEATTEFFSLVQNIVGRNIIIIY